MDHTNCVVTDIDRWRLGRILTTRENRAWGVHRWLDELESLLNEAAPIDAREVPKGLVTMGSTVELVDCATGARELVTLTYPQDVDLASGGISVFEPRGIALIGCREGDLVQCPEERCQRRWRIEKVVSQPERVETESM